MTTLDTHPSPTPEGNLTWLLSQGLTIVHLATALNVDPELMRAIVAQPDTPMSQETRTILATLSSSQVAAANNLVSLHDLKNHINRLTLQGCRIDDIEATLNLRPGALRTLRTPWVDTHQGAGAAWRLTIDDIEDPKVPAALTIGRLDSLATMGWGTDDIEATIGPIPTDLDPAGVIDRGLALDVATYWATYSGRLNTTDPQAVDRANQARAAGTRTPADWDPPTSLLWWPPSHLRNLLDEDTDLSCGPTPRRT